ARMDARRAASDAVMASSGAHRARVTRYSESRATTAPARCPFFRFLSLGKQRKEVHNSKEIETFNRSDAPPH
ncbi:MAG: hypothetical protein II902_04410, partial [Selenomonadaceae bacterium]|nr:hypothetical protein [Selenomonadaceae bacterium]